MSLQRNNRRVMGLMLSLAVGMVGLAYASVPLYRMFCQLTGFGGTPQIALGQQAPGAVGSDTFKIAFNTDISPDLNWRFTPPPNSIRLKAGQSTLVAFRAQNLTNKPLTGTATYNIVPENAAQYFIKTECFCFNKQTLLPGQEMDFPVMFYLEPDILKDPDLENLHEITLSYTFYPSHAAQALENKPASAY